MNKFTISPPAWLSHPALQKLLTIFEQVKLPYRFVGGCVRETLAGRPIGDIDMATPFSPDQVMAALAGQPVHVIPTGIKHGTLTLVVDHHPFEITTLRQDVDHDGRWATVEFTDDWAIDAERRDFTLNAFSMLGNDVYDYVNGIDDLKAHRVRFIGDPKARIREDYLRILRYFRFIADYQGEVHAASFQACVDLKSGLVSLSGERIHTELMRLMDKKNPQDAVKKLMEHRVLSACFTDFQLTHDPVFFEDVLYQETAVMFYEKGNRALRRLFVFFNPESEGACKAISERLKFSNEEKKLFLCWYKALSDFGASEEDVVFYRFLDQYGADVIWDMLLLIMAKFLIPLDKIKSWVALAESGVANHFPVKAADFKNITGPDLGIRLKQARVRWVESGFTLGKADLL